MNKIYYHIIEYVKHGTLWMLINNLSTNYKNHKIIETKEQFVSLKNYSKDAVYIFHSAGKRHPMISNIQTFIEQGLNCAIFMHVDPYYIKEKGYESFNNYLKTVQAKYNIKVFAPSKKTAHDFTEYGIDAKPLQLGIPKITLNGCLKNHYEGLFITMASNDNPVYLNAKGIDLFCDLMEKNNCQDQAMILGIDLPSYRGIKCKAVAHDDFLKILSKAKMYIQLSRHESYNITSIEAKQLKVPQLLSNEGGHVDSMPSTEFKVDLQDDIHKRFNEILLYDLDKMTKILEKNYRFSIEEESIDAFRRRIESNL